MNNLCCYSFSYHPHHHQFHQHQHPRQRAGTPLAAASTSASDAAAPGSPNSPNSEDEDPFHRARTQHGQGGVNFIEQVIGAASFPKRSWEQLTDEEKTKIFNHVFEAGVNPRKVLYSTLVILDHLSKKCVPFTTITTDVELNELEDDWKPGESRILCLTSATTPDWTHLYSLEFVSEDTGSVCTLEVEPNFLFQYSIPEKQFVVYNRKDKSKRLVFNTTSPAGLVDLVEVLNRSVALLNENKQRKLSSDNVAETPVQNSSSMMDSAPVSPGGAAGTSGENTGQGQGREPMTAARMIEIIKKFFHRKEERKVKRTTGKLKKMDISFPTDFRHVQHMGAGDPRASGTGELMVSNGLNGHNLLQVPTTSHASASAGHGGGDSSPPNPASPTNDKRTLSFIFDVIEECNAPPPPRAALNAGNRQTIQFPLMPQPNSDTGSLFGMQADIAKSQSGGNPERINLIEELKLYMEDEETKKLILEFVKTYEPDKSDSDLEPEKQSSILAPPATKSNKRWTSGRNSAPPPPKSPVESVSVPAAATFLSRINDTEQDQGQAAVDERPYNYSAVRESLRFELQQNLDSKPGCQEKGTAALLSRSNTWSNNQAKGPVGTFNTLPSPKPPSKPTAVKKTHSEVRRRPTTPPPPPKESKEVLVEKVEDGGSGNGISNVIGGGSRFSPEPESAPAPVAPPDEPVTITTKKPPPPIPKPRPSKMSQMRRANSNPADPHENEPKYANIKPTKSFDSGVAPIPSGADTDHDDALILPRAAQPVPSAANALLVAELRERIHH